MEDKVLSDETLPSEEYSEEQNPIDVDPGVNALPPDYVLLVDPPNYETAEIILATLAAEGIHGVMDNPAPSPAGNVIPSLGIAWSHAIYVAPEDFDIAREVLAASQPSEEELAQEQAADPTTLSDAEREVRDA
jgi:hypothetical protein